MAKTYTIEEISPGIFSVGEETETTSGISIVNKKHLQSTIKKLKAEKVVMNIKIAKKEDILKAINQAK